MPSKTKAQARLMAAAAHNPAFAKKVGIPVSVAKDFNKADKGKRFGTGGDVDVTYGGNNQINKQRTRFGSKFGYKLNAPDENLNKYIGKKEGGMATEKKESKAMAKKEISFMEKKGAPKSMIKHEKAEYGMKKGGMAECKTIAKKEVKGHEKRMHDMAKGGTAMGAKVDPRVTRMLAARTAVAQDPSKARAAAPMFARGGGIETKGKTKGTMVKMARGGGVETKGKTKGKMITMRKGGSCK